MGAFAVCDDPDDLLLITELHFVKQQCDSCSVNFDDDAVATFWEQCLAEGLEYPQFRRIWVHTHPACGTTPSATDDDTFQRIYGRTSKKSTPCPWAIMVIMGTNDKFSARIQVWVEGVRIHRELPVAIEWDQNFGASDFEKWTEEWVNNVDISASHAFGDFNCTPTKVPSNIGFKGNKPRITLPEDHDMLTEDEWQQAAQQAAPATRNRKPVDDWTDKEWAAEFANIGVLNDV